MKLTFTSDHPESSLVSTMAGGLRGSEILRIAADIRALKAEGKKILDLTVGDFSPSHFRIPKALEVRIAAALAAGETNYPPSNGVPVLREAVRRHFQRDLGLEYPDGGVVVAGGARPLIYGTYRALVDPGDTVVYPIPSWNNNHYCHLTGARGVVVETSADTRFLPSAAQLRPHLAGARLLALCSPLNPTGTAFTAEALAGICDAVLEENRRRGPAGRPLYVMYDQVYWRLTFGSTKHVDPVSLRPAMAPYTVFVDGISKAFAATGVRVGWGVGPPAVIARMSDILGHVGAWAPRAEQVAVAGFLDDPAAVETFRGEFLDGVHARLAALHHGFQRLAASGLPVASIEPMGAIYLTVQVRARGLRPEGGSTLGSNEDVRRYLLEKAGFALVPFQAFAFPGDDGWFRCSVGAIGLDEIERAMPRLESALRALR